MAVHSMMPALIVVWVPLSGGETSHLISKFAHNQLIMPAVFVACDSSIDLR